jgi:hypothetical protein
VFMVGGWTVVSVANRTHGTCRNMTPFGIRAARVGLDVPILFKYDYPGAFGPDEVASLMRRR